MRAGYVGRMGPGGIALLPEVSAIIARMSTPTGVFISALNSYVSKGKLQGWWDKLETQKFFSTNINCRYSSTSYVFSLLNKTSGAGGSCDPTKWKLRVFVAG